MDFLSHFHTAKDYFSDNHAHTWEDGVHLYITGLTTLLTATLLAAEKQGIEKDSHAL